MDHMAMESGHCKLIPSLRDVYELECAPRVNVRSTVHFVASGEHHNEAVGGPAACFQMAVHRNTIGMELSIGARSEAN